MAITKYHKLGGLKHQKFILSQLWRLEIQKGIGRVELPPKALEQDPSWPLLASGGPRHSLACSRISPLSAFVFTWPSPLYVSLYPLLFL